MKPQQEKIPVAVYGTLICVADAALAGRMASEVDRSFCTRILSFVADLPQLVDCMESGSARVILLDADVFEGASLVEFLRQLTETAPVVLLAGPEHQAEVSRLVAQGQVEFVARTGNFVSLAVSLVERRLRWAEQSEFSVGVPWAEMPADVAEIFRHEINNPLTGILGNAELVLSHGARMPAADTQRLQTVVELAVRLRETIRRLSDAWQTQPSHSLKSV